MTHAFSCHLGLRAPTSLSGAKSSKRLCYMEHVRRKFVILAVAAMLAPFVFAQGSPHVTAVDPPAGKVNDSVTVTGENLGKDTVSGVFLSDDKTDYKAVIVEQAAGKIVSERFPRSNRAGTIFPFKRAIKFL